MERTPPRRSPREHPETNASSTSRVSARTAQNAAAAQPSSSRVGNLSSTNAARAMGAPVAQEIPPAEEVLAPHDIQVVAAVAEAPPAAQAAPVAQTAPAAQAAPSAQAVLATQAFPAVQAPPAPAEEVLAIQALDAQAVPPAQEFFVAQGIPVAAPEVPPVQAAAIAQLVPAADQAPPAAQGAFAALEALTYEAPQMTLASTVAPPLAQSAAAPANHMNAYFPNENSLQAMQRQIAILENKLMNTEMQLRELKVLKLVTPSSLSLTPTPPFSAATVTVPLPTVSSNSSVMPASIQAKSSVCTMTSIPNSNCSVTSTPPGSNLYANINMPLSTSSGPAHVPQTILPRKLQDLPTFSGHAEEWPIFVTSYTQTTAAYQYTNLENHQRLQKSLTGMALDSVKSLLIFPDNVGVMMDLLGARFGRPEQLIRCQLSQIQLIKPIAEDSLSHLIPFATKTKNLVAFLQAANGERHLANPTLLDELVTKLPMSKKLEWAGYAAQILPYPTVVHFSDWINRVANLLHAILDGDVREPRRRVVLHALENQRVYSLKCSICRGQHSVAECKNIIDATISERWDMIKRHRLCFTCLKFGHTTRYCRSKAKCPVAECRRRHHELLHEITTESSLQQPHQTQSESEGDPVLNCASNKAESDRILFRVLPVTLYGQNKAIDTYALLDEGSSVTMLDSTLVSELGLKGRQHQLGIQWVGGRMVQEPTVIVNLYVSGVGMKKKHILHNVHGVSNLSLPIQSLSQQELHCNKSQLQKLPLHPYSNVRPKILIGLDHCHLGLPTNSIKMDECGPYAANTKLGWVVIGPVMKTTEITPTTCLMVNASADDTLHTLVAEYFETENFGIRPAAPVESEDDVRARNILQSTTTRVNRRFQTGLLWASDDINLPDSYQMALRRLIGIERKMKRDEDFAVAYSPIIQEYINKNYARKLQPREAVIRGPRTWYLPHFAVVNPNKAQKLRLVFDAAAKVNDISLNSHLLKGPQQLQLLPTILFNFRQGAVAVCADIKQMFHQVVIRREDRCAQRFLWRDGDDERPPDVYEMAVMTFGAACSPCVAHYVMRRNALEHQHQHPRAIKSIMNHHYVDDFVDSFKTEEEAIEISRQVRDIHANGGFQLRNFTSNSSNVLKALDGSTSTVSVAEKGSLGTEKVLGLKWQPGSDDFVFHLQFHQEQQDLISGEKPPTKRELLSIIMSVFDPLGFLSHFMISAKLLMREVWRHGIRWDDTLPNEVNVSWDSWRQQLSDVANFRVSRFYFRNGLPNQLQLHIFVDSSEDAFAAVAYWRAINDSGSIELSFVCAKTKCAPLKPLTIPRLELQAAVLGTRLMKAITEEHPLKIHRRLLWSDSTTVINWIQSKHRRYKPFVAHRIAEILSTTDSLNWRWVPTHDNIADLATRASSRIDLHSSSLWLTGPAFLLEDENHWPTFRTPGTKDSQHDDEELPSKYSLTVVSINFIDFNRFSSFNRLVRSIAWVKRFLSRCQKQSSPVQENGLTASELNAAEISLCLVAQREVYLTELEQIENQKVIEKSSALYKLCPYIGNDGVLRVYGRIGAASWLPFETKHPIILPPNHRFTALVVTFEHIKMKHQNVEATIGEIRRKYWIPRLRQLMHTVIEGCLVCRMSKAKPIVPLMGSLPEDRLSPFVRPFSYTGLDYFGPLNVTVGRYTEKRWIALFTCLTVRAIHLEIAHDLSTDACIMAIRNFINRRGVPVRIRSDNGTNFVGANQEAKRFSEVLDCEQVQAEMSSKRVEWVFNCPANSSEGGVWERMVQCVKRALAQTLKEVAPREYTLQCFLIEAENVVNSRPPTHLPIGPDQEEPLTPNHFLLGTANTAQTPSLNEEIEQVPFLRKQWRIALQLRDRMWKRWVAEYLPTLTRRTKWCQRSKPITKGDLVFVCHSNIPRKQWCRSRIEEAYRGVDGEVRRANVRTNKGILQRPVSKLAVLDLISESGRFTGLGMLRNAAQPNNLHPQM